MIKVDQTEFGPLGNCQSACLATLLGLPITQVPNWTAMNGSDQLKFDAMRTWLRAHGWDLITVSRGGMDAWPPRVGYFIAGGMSERGLDHAVIYCNGELWHDPHPDRTGIKSVETLDILYPLDPSKCDYRAGLERAAEICKRRSDERFMDHGQTDYETNETYYPSGIADEMNLRDEEDEDCAAAIRAEISKE